jgi:signal transduction protein with GAF and PtsI domain
VFDTEKSPSGIVKYLDKPKDVISLIQSGKLKDHILLVRGGTTTFLAPALSMGAIGVITMSGAPESHLGILSREFQTPCVMTAHLTNSDSRYEVGNTDEKHFQEIAEGLDGRKVRLDCTDGSVGRVIEIQ